MYVYSYRRIYHAKVVTSFTRNLVANCSMTDRAWYCWAVSVMAWLMEQPRSSRSAKICSKGPQNLAKYSWEGGEGRGGEGRGGEGRGGEGRGGKGRGGEGRGGEGRGGGQYIKAEEGLSALFTYIHVQMFIVDLPHSSPVSRLL